MKVKKLIFAITLMIVVLFATCMNMSNAANEDVKYIIGLKAIRNYPGQSETAYSYRKNNVVWRLISYPTTSNYAKYANSTGGTDDKNQYDKDQCDGHTRQV